MNRQINSNGQALEEGLDVFVYYPFLSGEYVSYGNSFLPSTLSTSNISTSTASYATEAVSSVNLPTYSNSNWFRFTSDGTSQPSVVSTPPTSSVNNIKLSAVVDRGSNSSVSGIFQELKQLYTGNEYNVTINLNQNDSTGTLSVSTLYNSRISPYDLEQSDITTYELPLTQITLSFKAYSTADILFISFESSVSGSEVDISSINIQEKNYYQFPVTTNLIGSGVAKVLRRKYNSSVPLEEGQPKPTD